MNIIDYPKFIYQYFLNSSQFSKIQQILENYGLVTYFSNWLQISSNKHSLTETHIIAINTDIIDRYQDIINHNDKQNLCNLTNSFANELFKYLTNYFNFSKITDNVYMEISANYGMLSLTSGDDGDYIYLMLTEF